MVCLIANNRYTVISVLTTSQGIYCISPGLLCLLLYPRFDPALRVAAASKLQEVAAESCIWCIFRQFHRNCLHMHYLWRILQTFQGQLDDRSELEMFLHRCYRYHESGKCK